MSGGRLNYAYETVEYAAGELEGYDDDLYPDFVHHLRKVAHALYLVEWVLSGDKSHGEEVEAIKACISPMDGIERALDDMNAAADRLESARRHMFAPLETDQEDPEAKG